MNPRCLSIAGFALRALALRRSAALALVSVCACESALAGDRFKGALHAERRPASVESVRAGDAAAAQDYVPPPYLSRTRNGAAEQSGPAMGAQESHPAGRLSPEERRQLRKTIQDASRDVYKR